MLTYVCEGLTTFAYYKFDQCVTSLKSHSPCNVTAVEICMLVAKCSSYVHFRFKYYLESFHNLLFLSCKYHCQIKMGINKKTIYTIVPLLSNHWVIKTPSLHAETKILLNVLLKYSYKDSLFTLYM